MTITIVVPTYNSVEFLGTSLKSIFKQTLKPDEILVINDASQDNTINLVESLQKDHPEIRLHNNKQNMGIGYSRGKGVELASSDHIGFISADDALERKFCEIMSKYQLRSPNSILYSDYFRCNQDLIPVGIYRSMSFRSQEELEKRCVLEARRHNMFICYNLFGPTKLWRQCNFDPNKRVVEDLEHLLRALLIHHINFSHVPFPLFKYRVHGKSVTGSKYWHCVNENRKTFNKINSLVGKRVVWDQLFKGKKLGP